MKTLCNTYMVGSPKVCTKMVFRPDGEKASKRLAVRTRHGVPRIRVMYLHFNKCNYSSYAYATGQLMSGTWPLCVLLSVFIYL